MRVMIFYDLPTLTYKERSEHNRFRKFLKRDGFIMMQESVYSKIALNPVAAQSVKDRVIKNMPKTGLIQVLTVTEKQYVSIDCILGDPSLNTHVLNSKSRLVVF